jgi:hypothetical protein
MAWMMPLLHLMSAVVTVAPGCAHELPVKVEHRGLERSPEHRAAVPGEALDGEHRLHGEVEGAGEER